MQTKLEDLNIISRSAGLRCHPGKFKILKMSVTQSPIVSVENEALEEVGSFMYQRSILNREEGTEANVKSKNRKSKGSI